MEGLRGDGCLQKVTLTVAALALTVAVAVAHRHPATTYELSIYAGTPAVFWVCLAVCIAMATYVAFMAGTGLQRFGLVLVGESILSVVALPIIRGYFYLGESDSLNHLGRARAMEQGIVAAEYIKYPVLHSFSVVTSAVTGVELPTAIMLFTLSAAVAFVLFFPLVISKISDRRGTFVVGTVAGLLLLPVDHLGTHLFPHPSSQAKLMLPFALYVFYQKQYQTPVRAVAIAVVLSIFLILFHPLVALLYLMLFTGMAAGRELRRRIRGKSFAVVPVYSEVLVFGIVWWLYIGRNSVFAKMVGIATAYSETEVTFFGFVGSKSESVEAVDPGLSLLELIVNIYAIHLLFGLMTLGLFGHVAYRLATGRETLGLIVDLIAGTIAAGLLFLVLLASALDADFVLRNIGFFAGLVAIFGAIAFARTLERYDDRSSIRVMFAVGVVVLLLVSVSTVHHSERILRPSSHVSEATYDGFETTFEYQNSDTRMAGMRSFPFRYQYAIEGVGQRATLQYEQSARASLENRMMTSSCENDYYFTTTRADYLHEVRLFNEYEISKNDFRYLDRTPGIQRVVTTRDYKLRLVYCQTQL